MGTVFTLPPRRAARASSRRTNDATILLFMGVRYVRETDPAEGIEQVAADTEPVMADKDLPFEVA